MTGMYRTTLRTLLYAGLLIASFGLVQAQQSAGHQGSPAADNSKMNQRDQSQSEPTADQQKDSHSDRDITRQIRRSIVADKSLSTYAHNVKIITEGGQVTLKGPVRSEEEKQDVASKAIAVAGKDKVTDELSVKTQN